MEQLLEKLAISKAIMDKHNQIKRGNATESPINISTPELQEFNAPVGNYNIPQEFLSEGLPTQSPTRNSAQPTTSDSIMKSKLPDEIKKLMIENPITPSNPLSNTSSVLSDELVEKASRLMGTSKPNFEPAKKITTTESKTNNLNNNSDLRKLLKEVVQEVLKENGLISESTSKTNEVLSLRVGQHIFEGKITKIKKIS
jgi:hypothetical protein